MVLKQAAAPTFSATIHFVVVGIGRVQGDWLPPLPSPKSDIERLVKALTDPTGCAIPESQVCCLPDSEGTKASVLAALATATGRAGPDDSIYFYFAGHGMADDQGFYLCTSDARKDRLGETAVSGTDIEKVLDSAACRGVLILLDCCEGAAFAEHAPSMFRKLRRGEFRILLSSARADQRSWERRGGRGTLFSNALIDIIEGNVKVGSTPGAAYFSDLVTAIDKHVSEGLQLIPGFPAQDMVFVGTYIRDPLILVHRALSLQQVQFATARYSPSYLRRVLIKIFLMVGGLIFFSATTAYGILNATQYVQDEGGQFVIYQGYPEYNLPGYPRRLWSLTYGAERLGVSEGTNGLRIVAPMGQPVYPLIEARLRPDMRLLDVYSSGRYAEARALAITLMKDSSAPFEQRRNAYLVFAMLAEPQDMDLLRSLLTNERAEIRLAALRALMRVAPNVGFAAAEEPVDYEASEVHVDVLRLLDGGCSPEIARYITNRFDTRSSHPTNEQIFDATVRLGCKLNADSLLRSVERPQMFGDQNASSYARLVGVEASFTSVLINRLRMRSSDILREGTLIGTLAELPKAPCIPEYRDGLSAHMLHVRLMAMSALTRHCQNMKMRLLWDERIQTARIDLLKRDKIVSTLTLATSDDQARSSLILLTRLHEEQFQVEGLRKTAQALLKYDRDDYLRSRIIQTLIQLGDKADLPAALLDSNNLEVRRAFTEYRRAQGDTSLIGQLLEHIGGDDDFYVELLGRMSLDKSAMRRLTALLEGSTVERRQAACVLSMQAAADVVLKLLLNSDSQIRSEATACVAFNTQAKTIVYAMPKTVNGLPLEGYQFIHDQIALKEVLEKELAAVPIALRDWRLSIVDTTPGSFGRLGRGLRYWLDEQRYQERLAARSISTSSTNSSVDTPVN